MPRTLARTAIAALVALGAQACDGCKKDKEPEPAQPAADAGRTASDAGPSGSAAAEGAAKRFCDDLYGVLDPEKRCGAPDKKREEYKLLVGVHQVGHRVCLDALVPSAAEGRVTIDEDAARACVAAAKDARDAAPLTASVDDVPACAKVVKGRVAPGGACKNDLDCADEHVCSGEAEGKGTCAKPAAKGAACEPTTPLPFGGRHATCARGLACDAEQRCATVAAIGERCVVTAGATCDTAQASCWNGRCRERARDKGECEFDADCAPGLSCARAPGKDKGACAPKKAAGAACRENGECRGVCAAGDAPEADGGATGSCVSLCGSG